jgi:hypothetical protein
MIKLEDVEVYGWESSIRGMRNPMNSWDRSDSHYCCGPDWSHDGNGCERCAYVKTYKGNIVCGCNTVTKNMIVGENDMKLMKSLVKAGSDHSKFMRMINVTVDITAPMYWWKEFDTYKVGTVRNSCSTMHKVTEKEFTLDDFSHEHLYDSNREVLLIDNFLEHLEDTVDSLNLARDYYLNCDDESEKKTYWWQIIQLLPSSYNQKATVQLNYAVLRNMYHSRKNHKLDEWVEFCKWVETLPYAKELICV